MSNGWPGTTSVTSSPGIVLFKSTRAGGSDRDGVLAISIKNTHASNSMEVRCSNIHNDNSEHFTLYAGESCTLEVDNNGLNQIDTITAYSASGATCTGTVTRWR